MNYKIFKNLAGMAHDNYMATWNNTVHYLGQNKNHIKWSSDILKDHIIDFYFGNIDKEIKWIVFQSDNFGLYINKMFEISIFFSYYIYI